MMRIKTYTQFINESLEVKIDDSLNGKTIVVLKQIMLSQETEESNGEPTVTNPGTELEIFRVLSDNPYLYARNKEAIKKDYETIGVYRYPVNKRKYTIGFNELRDLVKRGLVEIKK